ncbi:O-antigen ligase family protein [Pontibacter sp. MBLB2868]|uniref:O-antigen ligase family protein n=1 Tax=Pontibacter sp. MBLB2868 TaxID=3451555 RepID=UPI003F74D356
MRAIVQKGGALLERRNTSKIREVLYCLIAFSFPFSMLVINVASILLAIIFIIDLSRNKLVINYKLATWLLPLLFVSYSFSLLYTEDIATGLSKLETKLSLLILPVLICAYQFDKAVVRRTIFYFISGVTLAAIICIVNAFYMGYARTNGISILANQYFYDRDFFVSVIRIRPPYFGLYLSTALLFLINFTTTTKIKVKIGFLLFATSVVLFTGLLLTYSRMALLSLVFIVALWSVYYVISQRKITLLLLGLLSLLITVKIVYDSHFLNRRLVELVNTPIKEPGPNDMNSVSVRYGQIYCSLQILRENPVLGVGIGDTQNQLDNCYTNRNYHPTFIEGKLNTHNQYLDAAISSGIVGLLVLLFVYGNLIYLFFNSKIYSALFFVALMVLSSLSESVLNSFKGVVLFSFFCSVFIALANRSNNEAKTRD